VISLEIAAFRCEDVSTSTTTRWHPVGDGVGRLDVSSDAARVAARAEPGLEDARIHLVAPGEPVRIANVLDVVHPAAKVGDPSITFPGSLGALSIAGDGRTNRIDDVAVVAVCDLRSAGFAEAAELPPSLIDMDGPGRDATAWSSTNNIVIEFVPERSAPVEEVDRSIRRTTLATARDLAAATIGEAPGRLTIVEPRSAIAGDGGLPRICAILQAGSEGTLFDTYLYGRAMVGMLPTLLDPAEMLDGAITSGAYDWAGMRNPTAFYQRNGLIGELLAADGDRLVFAGLIVALGYLDSAEDKQRSAQMAARLAVGLGATGAVCTTFESGNSHTDTMLTVRACERLGIATTAILAETDGGLTDHVPEADSIVSTGNEDEVVAAWRPERIIGTPDATLSGPVPLSSYLGALCQMGDMRWTCVPV
jgi:glycine reductase complex component B subunit alpha and beta